MFAPHGHDYEYLNNVFNMHACATRCVNLRDDVCNMTVKTKNMEMMLPNLNLLK